MKMILFSLVLGAGLSHADDIVLNDGTVYKNAKILTHDGSAATILYDGGGVTVPLAKFKPEDQITMGYNVAAAKTLLVDAQAKQAAAAIESATQQLEKKIDAEAWIAEGKIIQVQPKGILIDLNLSRYVAVKVPHNHPTLIDGDGAHPMTDVYAQNTTYTEEPSLRCLRSGAAFIVCDTSGLVDDDQWQGKVWEVGTLTYDSVLGSTKTVRKYTTSREDFTASFLAQSSKAVSSP